MAKPVPRLSPEEVRSVTARAWDDLPLFAAVLRRHRLSPGRVTPPFVRACWHGSKDSSRSPNDRLGFRRQQLRFGLKRSLLDRMLVRVPMFPDELPSAFALHARFADAFARAVAPLHMARLTGAAPEAALVATTR